MISARKYVTLQGSICPSCGSCQIEAPGFVEVEGSTAWQEVHCLECGSFWIDLYLLQGYCGFAAGVRKKGCFVAKISEQRRESIENDEKVFSHE